MRPSFRYLLIAFAVLCMSTASILIRYSEASSIIIALYRVFFTGVMALVLAGPNLNRERSDLRSKDWFWMIGAGIFLALHFAFWITSLDYTCISSSVLFTNLQVIFVLLFSILIFKEQVRPWVTGGIIIAVAGSSLVAAGDFGGGRFLGDMLALASGFFVAVYFLIGRQIRSRVNVWLYTATVSMVAAVVLLITAYCMGLKLAPYPAYEWGIFLLLALGPGIAGHGILNWALKYVKAPIVAVSILGETVGASILAYLIFGETLLWYQWIGGACILCGIYQAVVNDRSSGQSQG